jgi:hypothetical protein
MKPKTQSKVNRLVAKTNGHNKYEGRPCINCGGTTRYVNGSGCIKCITERTVHRSPDIHRRYAHSEKGKAREKRYKTTQTHKNVQNRWKRKDYKAHPEKYKIRNIRNHTNNPDTPYKGHLKHRYNLSLDDYNSMLIAQDYKCAICGVHQDNLKKRLHLDHDHITGQVRGLLCGHCNRGLGDARENISILENMILYLKKYNDKV